MSGDEHEKINALEYFKTLNGFEEIAVEKMFGRSPAELAMRAENGNTFGLMRALLFVEAKRAGVKDGQAYRDVMSLTAVDVTEQFDDRPDAEGKEPEPEPEPEPVMMSTTHDSWFSPESPSPWSSTSP